MAFRRGQKVTPIDADPWDVAAGYELSCEATGPALGEILTIVNIVDDDDGVWLEFAEWTDDDLFAAHAFRPLTDISIFEKMLAVREIETVNT